MPAKNRIWTIRRPVGPLAPCTCHTTMPAIPRALIRTKQQGSGYRQAWGRQRSQLVTSQERGARSDHRPRCRHLRASDLPARPRTAAGLNLIGLEHIRLSNPRRPAPSGTHRHRPPLGRPTGNGRWVATSCSPVAASSFSRLNSNAGRFLGIVFETVVPVGMIEPDREYGVAGKCQAARRRTRRGRRCGRACARRCDGRPPPALPRAPRRTAAAGCCTSSQNRLAAGPKRIRKARRHVNVGEVGRLPELDLGGRHVDPQVRTQLAP